MESNSNGQITDYQKLIDNIGASYQNSQNQLVTAVNQTMLQSYWQIGKYIVEFEQQGEQKAEYGKHLMVNLSKDLTARFGKGFSRSNFFNMRLLYLYYPKIQTLSGKLSWSHYVELLTEVTQRL